MIKTNNFKDYLLLDTGDKQKLESWNGLILDRPDPMALWPKLKPELWSKAKAVYHRSNKGGGSWEFKQRLPEYWTVNYQNLKFKVSPTGFKHTGLFPEQAANWDFISSMLKGKNARVLNLFAYTGAASMVALNEGAEVVHVDASKSINEWAKENRNLNNFEDRKIRFIVDDCLKFMQREKRIGRIIVDSKPIYDIDKSLIINIICEAIRKDGLSMFDWNEQVQLLQRRVAQVTEWHPELEIPNLSTPYLMEHAQDWLPFYLEEGNHVISTNSELKKINLKEVLWNSIPYDLQQEIDRLAPTHIQVPSGSRIKLDYRQGTEIPVLSVRLQECFGMKETPCVNDGKQPVLMELLSPGFKPVQLTQDLGSFWKDTYFEVRKELKRRYPKHFWPENPLESEAVKGVKR